MAGKIIVLFLLISSILCEDCQIFNFENGTDDLGTYFDVCNSFDEWSWNLYSSIPEIPIFNEKSTAFIEPAATPSCISTGVFPMRGGGTLEINVYIQSTSNSEFISVIVNNITGDENHVNVINSLLAASQVNGWHVWRISISGTANYNAYLAFVSSAKSIGTTILIDSIRYIPSTVSEEVCTIYSDESDTPEEPITDEPETEEPITDEPETEEPITDEPETEEPNTDEPETEEPITDEPDTEEPITDESETEASVTDEPETGESETEEPITDEPETEESETEEPEVEGPIIESPSNSSFWNPLTISMVVILILILIFIISLTFYELGKRNAKKRNETIILDVEEIPPVRIVPRVNKVNNKDWFWY